RSFHVTGVQTCALPIYGVRGEVKIYSFTDPIDNLLGYPAWTLKRDGEVRQVELVSGRLQGKILVAKLKGLDDREVARTYAGFDRSEERRVGRWCRLSKV